MQKTASLLEMGKINQPIFMEWVEAGNQLFYLICKDIPQRYFLTLTVARQWITSYPLNLGSILISLQSVNVSFHQ
jgi:hypothetical protein